MSPDETMSIVYLLVASTGADIRRVFAEPDEARIESLVAEGLIEPSGDLTVAGRDVVRGGKSLMAGTLRLVHEGLRIGQSERAGEPA